MKRRPGSGRARTAAVLVALALSAGACTDDDPADEPSENASEKVAPEVQLHVKVGEVTGKLKPPRRKALASRVGEIVAAWFDAAYLEGDYPRTDFKDVFPGFTKDAATLARRDRDLLSNARLGSRIDGVEAVRKAVAVDLFSPGRNPSGATARFRLTFVTSGDVEQTVIVQGRLMLAPRNGVWKVFAYDVQRSVGAVELQATDGSSQ